MTTTTTTASNSFVASSSLVGGGGSETSAEMQFNGGGGSEDSCSSNHTRTPSSSTSGTSSSCEDDGVLLSIANLSHQEKCSSVPPPAKKSTAASSSTNEEEDKTRCYLNEITTLKSKLKTAEEVITSKEEEITRLSKIRDEVERELEDLTASLFTEAHKMVNEANVKRERAEKNAKEASMQIDGLTTEVAALKVMVLTSTPSHPNRHLHPQIDPKVNNHQSKSNPSSPRTPGIHSASSSSQDSSSTTEDGDPMLMENKLNIDPILRKEYLNWKKVPNLDRSQHPFLERIYVEDIDQTLNFADTELSSKVYDAIHDNSLSIIPISKEEMGESNQCSLLLCPMLCKYRMKLADGSNYDICQLSRNRIISVCDCLNYLRYVTQGLVKSHANDVYWEIMQLRKKILLARLGFTPSTD